MPASDPGASPKPQAQRSRRVVVAISAAVLTVALAVAIGLRAGQRFAERPDAPHAYRASLALPNDVTFFGVHPNFRLALSPDGSKLAFAAIGPDGQRRLYVRSLDSLTAQPLAGTEGAVVPFWSPDGRFIGYFQDDAGDLKKVSASGGPSMTLCDARLAWGAHWSKENVILFATGGGDMAPAIRRVPASGGSCTVVLSPDSAKGEVYYWLPHLLPDGRHFTYIAADLAYKPLGLYVASLGSNERKLLVPSGSGAQYAQGYLTFLRGQTLMAQRFEADRLELAGDPVPIAENVEAPLPAGGAWTVSQTGLLAYQTASGSTLSRLTWFDRAGRQLATVGDEADYRSVRLSPDGRHASVSLPHPSLPATDIWLVDLVRGQPTRFTVDAAEEQLAVWSPDGTRLVFSRNSTNTFDLLLKATNGVGAEELLLSARDGLRPASWSPDGRFLLYMDYTFGNIGSALWALPFSGERKPFPVVQSQFNVGPGDFSPDGRWLVYVSTESGRPEAYVAPFPGPGGKTRVSTNGLGDPLGGGAPLWRGQEIFYADPGGNVMAASVRTTGTAVEIGEVHSLFRLPISPQAAAGIYLWSFWDASADGQRFLVSVPQRRADVPISLVVNWPSLLKK